MTTSFSDFANSPALQRLLRLLESKPNLSAGDLSAEAFVGITTLACGGYLQKLKAKRLIYISGWRMTKGRFATPLYSLGSLADVAQPKVDESCRDAPGMWKILETLKRLGPQTYQEIASHSGLSPNTVKNSGYLRALIAQGFIHIGGWKRSHRGAIRAVYRAGSGLSAEKPLPISASEKSRRQREKRRVLLGGTGLAAQIADLHR